MTTETNPYAAPKAPVADAAVPMQGDFVPGGRALSAGRGWAWIVEGWNLFKRQPATWIGIAVLLAVIFVVLAIIPVLGSLAAMVLAPVFGAGVVIGSRAIDEGANLEVAHLFAGFRERFGTLASVGLVYLGASVAIALVVGLATGAGLWGLVGGGADPLSLGAAGATLLLALLVMMALMLPVLMAVWFSPPLVVFHDLGAGEAMKQSFVACLRNVVPFLVYGVILLLLSMLASLPFGLGWLVLGPVLAGSLYTSYRDIFFEQSG
jgi:uncharacterized membrane protein